MAQGASPVKADETYLKVQGRGCYLYRAIDRDGNLIDTMLSATRDMKAARGSSWRGQLPALRRTG
jgi:transposase-like protein